MNSKQSVRSFLTALIEDAPCLMTDAIISKLTAIVQENLLCDRCHKPGVIFITENL